ncbi:MAG TPA: hypothetical protein VH542_12775 [Steroidobacteraceae bacterium]|jgi:hypothetical protein
MNTRTIRQLAFTAVLATAAVVVSATQAGSECVREDPGYASSENYVASLGHMYVEAPRVGRVANLGRLVVTARRDSVATVAQLGSLTVTARRQAPLFADLGAMTVTAHSTDAVTLAARTTDSSWN